MSTVDSWITLSLLLEHMLQLHFIQTESSLCTPRPLHSKNQSMVWGQSGDLLQECMPDSNSNANLVPPLTTTRRLCKGLLSVCRKVRVSPTVNN